MLPEAIIAQGNIANQKAISLWKKKDTNARLILMTTISPKEQQAFVNCRSAFAIWTKLAAQHMQNASASTHVLQANFFHYQYIKGHTIMQHITAIKGMAQQLVMPRNDLLGQRPIIGDSPEAHRIPAWERVQGAI